MDIFTQNFRVNLTDLNPNNEMTNSAILRILQEIGGIQSSKFGYGLNDMQKKGLGWIILYWKIKIFRRPCWYETLKVSTWIREISKVSLYRNYEILDENGERIAIACSKWILFDVSNHNILKITPEIQENFIKPVNKSVFEDTNDIKFQIPENLSFKMDYLVSKRDIDTNFHVNNVCYVDFANEIVETERFSNMEVMYKHEAKLGEKLAFYTKKEDTLTYIVIKSKETDELKCILKFYN